MKISEVFDKFETNIIKRRDYREELISNFVSKFNLCKDDVCGLDDIVYIIGKEKNKEPFMKWFKSISKKDLEEIGKCVYNSVFQLAYDVFFIKKDNKYYKEQLFEEYYKVVALMYVSYDKESVRDMVKILNECSETLYNK